MRYLIVLGAKLHTLILRARLSKKMNPIFKKKFFYSDYQIFISLIKTHKKGPQKSLRAKICDLRVKTLYLRATINYKDGIIDTLSDKYGIQLANISLLKTLWEKEFLLAGGKLYHYIFVIDRSDNTFSKRLVGYPVACCI